MDITEAQPPAGIVGGYAAYVRYVDDLGRPSALSPISNALTLAADDLAYGFLYTDVPVPTDPTVVRKQIWRNAAGSPETLYLDIDSTDLTATEFSSTKRDDELIGDGETSIKSTDDTPTPGLDGTYYAYVRYINELGQPSNLSPISNALIL